MSQYFKAITLTCAIAASAGCSYFKGGTPEAEHQAAFSSEWLYAMRNTARTISEHYSGNEQFTEALFGKAVWINDGADRVTFRQSLADHGILASHPDEVCSLLFTVSLAFERASIEAKLSSRCTR